MSEYKPGDQVLCIETHRNLDLDMYESITIGKVYTIESYNNNNRFPIRIKEDDSGTTDLFEDYQFILATPENLAHYNFPNELERLINE